MANTQRDLSKEQGWREAIVRHGASGLSVRAFCRREGLKETSFFAWRRTIRERDEPPVADKPPAFVPAVVASESSLAGPMVLETSSGCVLRLPSSTPAAWVAELLAALQSGAGR